MKKAYIVEESWGGCSDYSMIAVFLDEKKCDEFIKEKRKDREKEDLQIETCKKCRVDETTFLLKDSCELCKIGKDRHGVYCENDASEGFNYTNNYYKTTTDLFE